MSKSWHILGVSLILNGVFGVATMLRDITSSNAKESLSFTQMDSEAIKKATANNGIVRAGTRATRDDAGNEHVAAPWPFTKRSLGGLCDSDFGINDACAFSLGLSSDQVENLDEKISQFIKDIQQLELDNIELKEDEESQYILIRDNALQRENMWVAFREQVTRVVGEEKSRYVIDLLKNDKELALTAGSVEIAITMSGKEPWLQRVIMGADGETKEVRDAIDEKLTRRYRHLLDFDAWDKHSLE